MRVDPQHDCLAPLVPRASRASCLSCLAPLMPRASQQRAPLSNVRLSATRSSSSSTCASPAHLLASSFSSLLEAYRLVRFLPLTQVLCSAISLNHCAHALFWARCIRVRQSGGHATPPPCLSSLRKQAEEDEHSLRRSARAFWQEISPRFGNRQMMSLRSGGPRGRFGGKPRRGHAASPSIPRGA